MGSELNWALSASGIRSGLRWTTSACFAKMLTWIAMKRSCAVKGCCTWIIAGGPGWVIMIWRGILQRTSSMASFMCLMGSGNTCPTLLSRKTHKAVSSWPPYNILLVWVLTTESTARVTQISSRGYFILTIRLAGWFKAFFSRLVGNTVILSVWVGSGRSRICRWGPILREHEWSSMVEVKEWDRCSGLC